MYDQCDVVMLPHVMLAKPGPQLLVSSPRPIVQRETATEAIVVGRPMTILNAVPGWALSKTYLQY